MLRGLSHFAPAVLGATRVFAGVLLASHGAQKLLGAFGGIPEGVPGFIVWTAGPIELVGGALLAVGLLTRPTAFLMSGLMAFAYVLGHAGSAFWPIQNGGELAIVYGGLALYFAAQGPGAWALDSRSESGATPRPGEPEQPALRAA